MVVPILSLNEITAAAGRGEFDFLLTNPSSYVEIEELHKAKILATLNNRRANSAQSRFGTVIFTHARNKNIYELNDLKGRALMAVAEPAFGGWRVAWYEMKKNGIDPYSDLKTLVFAENNTQPEVVYAVRDQQVDVGVVRTDQLERMEADGKIDMRYFRILNNKNEKGFPFFLSTSLYPEWAFAALKDTDGELAQDVKRVLTSIEKNSAAAMAGRYVGWIEPLDYSSVRELMKDLEVGPYAK